MRGRGEGKAENSVAHINAETDEGDLRDGHIKRTLGSLFGCNTGRKNLHEMRLG